MRRAGFNNIQYTTARRSRSNEARRLIWLPILILTVNRFSTEFDSPHFDETPGGCRIYCHPEVCRVNNFDWTAGNVTSNLVNDSCTKAMNSPTITVCGHLGSIFEGELPETFCFVPQECVSSDSDGVRVNEIEYVQSGWGLRNMRLSDAADGEQLFPKSRCQVVNLDTEPVRHFLDRIKIVRCA